MKNILILSMFIVLFLLISCEKDEVIKLPSELVGLWKFETVQDGFGNPGSMGTGNLNYENFQKLNLEFKKDYTYQNQSTDPQFILNEGIYKELEGKIYIANTNSILDENNEFLKILEFTDSSLIVEHGINIEIDGEKLTALISNITFSKI